MAYAIATIVIMLCVIVALSINLVRERKAHMTFIHSQTVGIDAPFLPRETYEFVTGVLDREKAALQIEIDNLKADVMNANMHVSVLSEDKVTLRRIVEHLESISEELQEQVAVLQNRCNLLGCELKIEFFQYSMLLHPFHVRHHDGQRHCDALEDAKELLFKEGHHDEESWNEQIRSMLKAVKQELGIDDRVQLHRQ